MECLPAKVKTGKWTHCIRIHSLFKEFVYGVLHFIVAYGWAKENLKILKLINSPKKTSDWKKKHFSIAIQDPVSPTQPSSTKGRKKKSMSDFLHLKELFDRNTWNKINIKNLRQVWWHEPLIIALRRKRWGPLSEFQASLICRVSYGKDGLQSKALPLKGGGWGIFNN